MHIKQQVAAGSRMRAELAGTGGMPTKRNLLLMALTAWSLLISPPRVNAQTQVQILDKRCTDVSTSPVLTSIFIY